jgi:hypothetical protein
MRRLNFVALGSLVSVVACGGSETGGTLFGSGAGGKGAAAGLSADASTGSGGQNGTSGQSGTGAKPSSSGGRGTGDGSSGAQGNPGGTGGVGAGAGGGTNGGTDGSSSGGATSNGGASNGGSSAQGGSGGTSSGGTSGQGGSGGGCQAKTWCRDRDHDGFGNPSETELACTQPGGEWTEDCGDCHDDNGEVHPGVDCHDGSYLAADGVTMSFDWDCDGQETECGTFVKANANGCGVVGPLNCAGSGYLPNPNRTATAGQNAYCGSTAYRNCVSVGLPCVPQATTKTAVVCH